MMASARHTARASLRQFGDPAVVADPFPWYAALRSLGPLIFDQQEQLWICTGYKEAETILGDTRERFGVKLVHPQAGTRSLTPLRQLALQQVLKLQLPFLDGPLHRQVRMAVQPHCTPQMADLRETALQHLTDEHLAPLFRAPRNASVDIIADFAEPLSLACSARFLTLPSDSLAYLTRWSAAYQAALSGWAGVSNAEAEQLAGWLEEAMQYFTHLVNARRLHPQNDLISHMLQVLVGSRGSTLSAEQEALSVATVAANILGMLAAGYRTVAHLVAMSLLWLWREPDLRGMLEQKQELWGPFLKEVARLSGPQQYLARQALQDVVVSKKRIRRGQTVLILLAAANRDSLVYSQPDACKLDRDQSKPPLSFGQGQHACLGEHYTLRLVQIATTTFLRRFPAFQLSIPEQDLCWESQGALRLLRQLPLHLTARSQDDPQSRARTVSSEREEGLMNATQPQKAYTLDLAPDGSTAVLSLDLTRIQQLSVRIEAEPRMIVVTAGNASQQEIETIPCPLLTLPQDAPRPSVMQSDQAAFENAGVESHQQTMQPPVSAPRLLHNEVEEQMQQLFASILDLDVRLVNSQTDFFDAGGDSLCVAALLSAIHQHYQVDLDPLVIFDHPVLGELLKVLIENLPLATEGDETAIPSHSEEVYA